MARAVIEKTTGQIVLHDHVNLRGDTMTGALNISLATGNSLVVDTTTLVVDASNNRVGIGTASPQATLHLVGDYFATIDTGALKSITGVNVGFTVQQSTGFPLIGLFSTGGSNSTTNNWIIAASPTGPRLRFGSINDSGTFLEQISLYPSILVVNEDGADQDFRVEGDTQSSLFFVDAGLDTIGIAATPSATARVNVAFTTSQDQATVLRLSATHNTATAGTVYGATVNTTATHTTGTMNAVEGLFSQAIYGGTSASSPAVTNLMGAFFRTVINGVSPTGTVSNAYGFYIDPVSNQATGTPAVTFTNQYGVYINNQGLTNGTNGLTITNGYGLYIANQSTAATINSAITTNSGNIIFNEGGDANTDFRVEGDTNANLLFVDASTDAIGIGTATPSSVGKLQINGGIILGATAPSAMATGDYYARGGMSIGNQSTDPLSQGVFDLVDSRTLAAATTSWRALRGISNVTPGVDNISIRGLEFIARDNNSGSFNIATIEGINARGQLQNTSGITVSNMRGLSAVIVTPSTSTSTVNDARGIDVAVTHSGGTIGNLYGIRINTPSGSSTVTTQYGLYIADINLGATSSAIITNAGNIVFNEGGDASTDLRVEGDTDTNLLFTDASADFVGIGTNAPVSKLDVSQATGGILTLRRVDTSITANDVVGAMQWYAADTSTTTTFVNAKIEVQATNTITTDINPTRMIFSTTPTGVAGVLTEALRITEAQAVVTAGELEVNGDLNHDGTNIGFFGVTPAARATTYAASNITTDRTYDADATTLDEIADVLGTLIADLRTYGLVT